MPRRTSPKGVQLNADRNSKSVKSSRHKPRSPSVSMKNPKRKREAAAKAPATIAAEVAVVEVVPVVEPTVVVEATAVAEPAPVVVAVEQPVVSVSSPAEPTVVLASNCSVKDAGAFKQSLVAVVDEAASVTFDVRSVERVDTATIQLLYAFAKERQAHQRAFSWLGESPALIEAARLLGVSAVLALPLTAGAAA